MKKSPVLIEPWLEAFTAWGGIDANDLKDRIISVKLREANNLLHINWNDELYCDLQLPNGLKPTDTIPVWRTVGRVLANDGWRKTWTLVCEKTTSGDIVQLLYADDGTIWINRGNGWSELKDRHSIFVTEIEYNALPSSKLTDGNCYIIVDEHPNQNNSKKEEAPKEEKKWTTEKKSDVEDEHPEDQPAEVLSDNEIEDDSK